MDSFHVTIEDEDGNLIEDDVPMDEEQKRMTIADVVEKAIKRKKVKVSPRGGKYFASIGTNASLGDMLDRMEREGVNKLHFLSRTGDTIEHYELRKLNG